VNDQLDLNSYKNYLEFRSTDCEEHLDWRTNCQPLDRQ